MPEKELTVLEAGGSEISGGQRARVAIARMLAHPKPLMIFDDPFSALDRGTEKECMENLRRRQDGSIYMIISHRLWMFPSFDRIVFLENGRAVVGTHDELMRSCPGYRMLYEKQTGGAA
jgi:ATP-binding cassette subfamily B multidrug efflux pump